MHQYLFVLFLLVGSSSSAFNLVITTGGHSPIANEKFSLSCKPSTNASLNALWWSVLRAPSHEPVNVTSDKVKPGEENGVQEATLVFDSLGLPDIGKYICNAAQDGGDTQFKHHNLTFSGSFLCLYLKYFVGNL